MLILSINGVDGDLQKCMPQWYEMVWDATEQKPTYPQKYVSFVNVHLPGERNGRTVGMTSNIAQNAVENGDRKPASKVMSEAA
jgi:hypothetical protein